MDHASPFGRPLFSKLSQEDKDRQENSIRFGQLKPICVELLGQVSSAEKVEKHDVLYKTLKRLQDKLISFRNAIETQHSYSPLSPALISYIFYPIAQLLRSTTNWPDRIKISQFTILSLLTDDWWQSWTIIKPNQKEKEGFQVWEQLLILSANAFDGKSKHESQSDECSLAILALLESLLIPRKTLRNKENVPQNTPQTNWEWDGESDLPDLDDYEAEMQRITNTNSNSNENNQNKGELSIIYPTDAHLDHTYASKTCQGALAHVLTSVLEQAKQSSKPVKVRVTCLRLVKIVLKTWIAGCGTCDEGFSRMTEKVQNIDFSLSSRKEKHFSSTAQADRLAISLPATVSALIRICNQQKSHSEVLSQTLSLLRFVLVSCLNDQSTNLRSLSKAKDKVKETNGSGNSQPSLDELIANTRIYDENSSEEDNIKVMDTDSATDQNDDKTIRNSVWLKDTVGRIAFALQAFSKELLNNNNESVQVAIGELASGLLNECYDTLNDSVDQEKIDLIRLLFDWILDVSSNEGISTPATESALQSLIVFLSRNQSQRKEMIANEITNAAQQMPTLFVNPIGQDEVIIKVSKRIQLLASLASGGIVLAFTSIEVLSKLFSSQLYERWLFNVVSSLTIDTTTISDRVAVRIFGTDSSTSKAVLQTFNDLGSASARLVVNGTADRPAEESTMGSIEYLLQLSHRWRSSNRKLSVNALLVARQAITGIADILDDEKLTLMKGKEAVKLRKSARKFARKIIGLICEIWQTDEEELLNGPTMTMKQTLADEERQLIASQQSETDILTEQIKGVHSAKPNSQANGTETELQLGPAVNVDFVQIATIADGSTKSKNRSMPVSSLQRRKLAIDYAQLGDTFLLEILSQVGKIMGPAIKSSFIHLLYPTICAIASSHPSVHDAAAETIQTISYSAGYASIEGCLLDHADYILGAASHRLISTLGEELQRRSQFGPLKSNRKIIGRSNDLSLLSLSLREGDSDQGAVYYPLMSAISAPLVLVELIRTLGTEVVVLVEDAIDEVLDAIDRFHGDSDICDGLLSVLDKMVEVMLNNIKEENMKALPSPEVGYQPNAKADMEDFVKWYHNRGKKVEETDEQIFDKLSGETEEEEMEKEDLSDPVKEETSLERSQKVTVSMMMKAIPFLSHSSRTIRIRCLHLINRGVELLCRQGLTAEPLSVINACWPILMSRVGFSLARTLKPNAFLKPGMRTEQMDEQDFFVAIEAVKLFTTLVRYLHAYLGSEKVLRQALPRILLLVSIVEQAEHRPGENMTSGSAVNSKQTTFLLREGEKQPDALVKSSKAALFRPFREGSPLAILVDTTLRTLNTLVYAMGASITEADLLAFATHPTFLTALDIRQAEPILKQARQLYFDTLQNRNPALVWWVIQATSRVSQTKETIPSAFPAYLSKPNLQLIQS